MIGAAKPLGNYLVLKNISIYDSIFILHSKCTVVILLFFTLLLSTKQYFGVSIECMADLNFLDFVHSYCWTFGTFSVPTTNVQNSISVGVGPDTERRVSLRYYQWVVIVLLVEATFFYLPAFIWKLWEGKLLEQLCSPVAKPIIPHDENKEYCHALVSYFKAGSKLSHKNYVIKYFICELMNLCTSIINIIFLEKFFNGYWLRYWNTISILSLNNWETWNHYTSQIFPKLAKCKIFTFGMGGSINNYDALCMLPLNNLNEKIFAFLWFWFIFITILAVLKIIFNLWLLFSVKLRIQLFRKRINDVCYYQLRTVVMCTSFGDWFLLYKISLNVNPLFFRDLVLEFYEAIHRTRFSSI